MNFMQIGDHKLPLREVDTPEGIIEVPSHIYRKALGWDIKICREDEPVFYEYVADSRGGHAVGSLSLAVETLYGVLPNYRTFDQLRPGSSHWYNVRERFHNDGHMLYQFVQTYICGYHNKLRTVYFYVGTPNTRSDKKLRLAIDRAIGTRCWSIETIRAQGRSILYQLPVPKHVERFAV